MIRRIHRHCEKKIICDGPYLYTLFGLFIVWSSTIRRARDYFCPCLVLRRMHRDYEKNISSDIGYFILFWLISRLE